MFSRIGRCGSSASTRSAGTSTTPARIASYGVRGRERLAGDDDLAARRLALAGEAVEQLRPGPGLRAPRRRAISPARSSNETPSGVVADDEAADLELRPASPRRRLGGARAAASIASASCGRASSPSISSTIFSSSPACGTSVPTVRPSRSTVARSQVAVTSASRWVMKRTERPRVAPLAHDREHLLGEVRRQRGGDLVEQQQLRVARERAREVEHPQRGQRQVAGHLARGRRSSSIRVEPLAHGAESARGQAQVLGDRQVRQQRRILEDGREADARARARASRCAPARR